jgi:hypothetical protein
MERGFFLIAFFFLCALCVLVVILSFFSVTSVPRASRTLPLRAPVGELGCRGENK